MHPFMGRHGPFRNTYACYPMLMLEGGREQANRGGKIILPPSALEDIAHRQVTYPLMFTLTNENASRVSHGGVLEFVAEEGRVYMPHWMMQNLFLSAGERVSVETVDLPVATFSKVQPLSDDFLEISDPRAVLENALRDFSCLTKGDTIAIAYNDREYQISVLEVKPQSVHHAVSIVECDMRLEFEAPPGYEERQRQKQAEAAAAQGATKMDETKDEEMTEPAVEEKAFYGMGHRLDRKNIKGTDSSSMEGQTLPPAHVLHSLVDDRKKGEALRRQALEKRIRPFQFGKLTFRPAKAPPQQRGDGADGADDDDDDDDTQSRQSEPFSGEGHALKPKDRSKDKNRPTKRQPKPPQSGHPTRRKR